MFVEEQMTRKIEEKRKKNTTKKHVPCERLRVRLFKNAELYQHPESKKSRRIQCEKKDPKCLPIIVNFFADFLIGSRKILIFVKILAYNYTDFKCTFLAVEVIIFPVSP